VGGTYFEARASTRAQAWAAVPVGEPPRLAAKVILPSTMRPMRVAVMADCLDGRVGHLAAQLGGGAELDGFGGGGEAEQAEARDGDGGEAGEGSAGHGKLLC
jgi:hypothetical protein